MAFVEAECAPVWVWETPQGGSLRESSPFMGLVSKTPLGFHKESREKTLLYLAGEGKKQQF